MVSFPELCRDHTTPWEFKPQHLTYPTASFFISLNQTHTYTLSLSHRQLLKQIRLARASDPKAAAALRDELLDGFAALDKAEAAVSRRPGCTVVERHFTIRAKTRHSKCET